MLLTEELKHCNQKNGFRERQTRSRERMVAWCLQYLGAFLLNLQLFQLNNNLKKIVLLRVKGDFSNIIKEHRISACHTSPLFKDLRILSLAEETLLLAVAVHREVL